MLNLPNLITISRLLLVPVFAWMLWQQRHDLALLIFVVAGLSDAVDGYLARRFNQTSRFGAMLDPIADKAILITALIVLTQLGLIPYWLALAVIGRDSIILLGAALYRLLAGRLEIVPTALGKLHTLFAFLVLSLVLGNAAAVVNISTWLAWLFNALLLSSVISAAHYIWIWGSKARQIVRKK